MLKKAGTKKENGIVYGCLDEKMRENHYMQLENVRSMIKGFPYYMTDFDFTLNGNPHLFGD